MITRAFVVAVGFFCLSGPLVAQQTNALAQSFDETISLTQLRSVGAVDATSALTLLRPDLFSRTNGSILIHNEPALVLVDGRRIADSAALTQMGLSPLDLIPTAYLKAIELEKTGPSPVYGADTTSGVVNLQLNRNYVGGEVGFFYGRSSGKFHGEDMQSYILSGIGNDTTQITFGASYEHSSGHVPR